MSHLGNYSNKKDVIILYFVKKEIAPWFAILYKIKIYYFYISKNLLNKYSTLLKCVLNYLYI